jgi:hypothetical protein
MLPTSRVDFIPAGKAPQRGADAVKASYLPSECLREPRCAAARRDLRTTTKRAIPLRRGAMADSWQGLRS